MFLNHFKLTEEPFGVTPDPRFLYLDSQHREALASLAYGTESNRGFLALIAKPGMGKTSLLYRYLESLRGTARTAYVFRTDCDSREFIRHVLLDLGIDAAGKDLPAMHEALNQVLVEEMGAGRRFVLVIDEAQNLADDVLESIRLLSNFETPRTKLMQIVIAGQPGLAEKLSRPSMAQLRQRISLVIRVSPLNQGEVNAYIDHRLSIAGCKDLALFTPGARGLIAEHSEGIPRKINNICFNSMSIACALRRQTVDRATVLEVLADLDLDSLVEKPVEATTAGEERPIPAACAPQHLTGRNKRWFQVWAPMSAIGFVLALAVVIGVNYREVRAANPIGRISDPAVRRSPVSAPTPTVQEPTSLSVGQERRPVRIGQGQTLYRISVDNLGGYDPQILDVIRSLNPWLSDPNNIPAGQQILLPSTAMSLTSSQHTADHGSYSSLREVGKQ